MNRKDLYGISRTLKSTYKSPRLGNKTNPLDELIFILLSGATIETNFSAAYLNLKRRFRKWENLLGANRNNIYKEIKHAGLGRKKAKIINGVVGSLKKKRNKVSLSYLNNLNNQDATREIMSFRGVGLKSAKCVLMYSLNRQVFPIDTHAMRILKRLGILKDNITTNAANRYLEAFIPNAIKYDLHVNLVALGRDACRANNPECSSCCLRNYCRFDKGAK